MNKKKYLKFGLRAKIKLAKTLKMKLGSVSTDKGELHFTEDEIAVGIEVFVKDADGADVMPEDGDYTFGNEIAVVVDGVVTEIKEAGENLEEIPTPSASNTPEQALDNIVEAIEKVVDVIEEEVKVVEENLSKRIMKLENEFAVAKQALTKANLANARSFADPNPKPGDGNKLSKGNEALKIFGL